MDLISVATCASEEVPLGDVAPTRGWTGVGERRRSDVSRDYQTIPTDIQKFPLPSGFSATNIPGMVLDPVRAGLVRRVGDSPFRDAAWV